jgi:hypothetical protein
MRSVIRSGLPSGAQSGSLSNYPKIKQGYIVDSGGEIIDSHHLAQGLLKKENHIFFINIEARCKCGLHNDY